MTMLKGTRKDVKIMDDMSNVVAGKTYEDGLKQGIDTGIEKGIEQGIAIGVDKGIKALIHILTQLGLNRDAIVQFIQREFEISKVEAMIAYDRNLEL